MVVLKKVKKEKESFREKAKKIFTNLHYPLLILVVIYAIFGLVMIFSASNIAAILRYNVSGSYFFLRQLSWLVIAFIFGNIMLFFSTKNYRFFSKFLMFGSVISLVLLFAVGKIAGGAKSWYDVGNSNIHIQPIEFVKIFLIIYMAVYYHRFSSKKNVSYWDLLFPMGIAAIICILVALQPDFGGAFIIFLIAVLMFLAVPIAREKKKQVYKISLLVFVIGGLLFIPFKDKFLHNYQISRILNYRNPCERYNEQSGYQVCNGYIAIHNGGLGGLGLGSSKQKYMYLPEAHTDFIFPIIVEELGLVVGILVVVGYFVMLYFVLDIAKKANTLRNSLLAYGIFAYLLSHILVNLLGVLGLIPLTGVPLPFLSYGGSYNTCVVISMFILQRIHYESKTAELRKKIERL